MPIDIINESTTNAMGGTELQAYALRDRLSTELLDKFQIIPSRVRSLDQTRKRILWLHDLPDDPENQHLANGGYNQFERIVFVSNWQMQAFIAKFGIPWYKCIVIPNSIVPLRKRERKDGDPIKIIYHTTPHRGLTILVTAFDRLMTMHPDLNAELDVYSSFKVYGWEERDAQYESLFEACRNHPKINYHGTVSNEDVKEAVSNADVFAYPSIWQETSCIALIEAMSAGLVCVHPNYGALYETAANLTHMYQFQENARDHLNVFTGALWNTINFVQSGLHVSGTGVASMMTNMHHSWDNNIQLWTNLLESIV